MEGIVEPDQIISKIHSDPRAALVSPKAMAEMSKTNAVRTKKKQEKKLPSSVGIGDKRASTGIELSVDPKTIPRNRRRMLDEKRRPTSGQPRSGDLFNSQGSVPKVKR